jgi:hypothetical protein
MSYFLTVILAPPAVFLLDKFGNDGDLFAALRGLFQDTRQSFARAQRRPRIRVGG